MEGGLRRVEGITSGVSTEGVEGGGWLEVEVHGEARAAEREALLQRRRRLRWLGDDLGGCGVERVALGGLRRWWEHQRVELGSEGVAVLYFAAVEGREGAGSAGEGSGWPFIGRWGAKRSGALREARPWLGDMDAGGHWRVGDSGGDWWWQRGGVGVRLAIAHGGFVAGCSRFALRKDWANSRLVWSPSAWRLAERHWRVWGRDVASAAAAGM